MSRSEQKIVQYLTEAHAHEMGLVRVLQSQIAMTPRGSYRTALETHLGETRDHAKRVAARADALGRRSDPLTAIVDLAETAVAQTLALGKTPFDLLRGSGGEEKVLKNAKDACATEALEIATYTAIEQLARSVGDKETEKLAASIRADEEKMLERIMRELPEAHRCRRGRGRQGRAVLRRHQDRCRGRRAARRTAKAKRTTRQARKVPGVAQAEGQVKGAVASESDLAIAGYDKLTAEEIVSKLSELSQIDLAKVDSYERKHQNRTTVVERITTLRGDEPWPGYDELTVSELQTALGKADDDRIKAVRTYERAHKARAGVLKATERELATA